MKRNLVLILLSIFAISCKPAGTINGPCFEDGTCKYENLSCYGDTCRITETSLDVIQKLIVVRTLMGNK